MTSTTRDYTAAAALSPTDGTTACLLFIEAEPEEVSATSAFRDLGFTIPASRAEEEISSPSATNQDVVVTLTARTRTVYVADVAFLELADSYLPTGWVDSAIIAGRCLVYLGPGDDALGTWAEVR